jgi:hypothetical protein
MGNIPGNAHRKLEFPNKKISGIPRKFGISLYFRGIPRKSTKFRVQNPVEFRGYLRIPGKKLQNSKRNTSTTGKLIKKKVTVLCLQWWVSLLLVT